MPSTPGPPLFFRTCFHAISSFPARILHGLFRQGRAFGVGLRHGWFGPLVAADRGFTPVRWVQGQRVLDVLPLSTHELSVLLAASERSGLQPSFPARPICCSAFRPWSASLALPTARPTMPSADSCAVVRSPCGSLSSEFGTRRRPPQVSSVAFPAHLPDLHTWPLMDMDFATSCSLVRPSLPRIRFLFVRSRFCSTLPSDTTSRGCPCALLILHLHRDFHFPATEHAGHTTKPRSAAGS